MGGRRIWSTTPIGSQELAADAGRDPERLRAAIELVEETRQRFQLNVSEELACEALAYRLERRLPEPEDAAVLDLGDGLQRASCSGRRPRPTVPSSSR